ncbi:putative transposase [Orientia tsutsugamushi str. TA763]|nr:putative transposase [Orientia tsutsugamushi str. TA763]
MPAMSALRHNCIIKQFSQRLSDTGKPKMLILIAAMRKLCTYHLWCFKA